MTTPAAMFRAAAGHDPGRPFLTCYDDATGERVELSFTTTANWVAKTANLLVAEIGAEPGERVGLWLPTHWQTVIWSLACWETGLVLAPWAGPEQCDHAVGEPTTVAPVGACPGSKVLVSLAPFGRPSNDVPPGWVDHARLVSGQPDVLITAVPVGATDPVLHLDGVDRDAREVSERARAAARELGLDRQSRMLLDGGLERADGMGALTHCLLAPLAVGASLVLCRNGDPAAMPRRIETERITHTPDGRLRSAG